MGEASSEFRHADSIRFGKFVASLGLDYEKGVSLPCTNCETSQHRGVNL